MLNILFNETDDHPVRTIKQAINQAAEGLKFSLASVAVLGAGGAIFFVCAFVEFAALCTFFVACGAWVSIACLIRYDTHLQSLIKLYELRGGYDTDVTIDF